MKRARPAIVGLAVAVVALLSVGETGGKPKRGSAPAVERPRNPDDLRIVDCSLPGQVRQLGMNQTYVSRRRAVRTTTLDCAIRGGESVSYDRADYRTALKVWLESAEAGDPQAQYYVAEIYERGLGTEPNYVEAASWYRKAAEKGHAQSQVNLGFLLEKGLGVTQDPRQALEWYRKAAGVSGVIMLDSEIEAVKKELAEADRRLQTAHAESEARERELETARRELEAARTEGRKTAAGAAELETRVADLEKKLGAGRQEVARLESALKRYDIAGPTIEIVNPSAVRSATASPPGATEEIVGRVEAPAGLSVLTADGERQSVGDGGFFRFRPRARRVTLVAVDLQGKRGERVYDADAAAPESVPAPRRARPPAKPGSYHAVVIGNGDYASLPRLETAVSDATAISEVLSSRFGFEVTTLQNARYMDMLSAFNALRETLRESDNVVIYFAGHGELDPVTGLGYWLPVDAEKEDRTYWMSSREISMQLEMLPARHVLVMADSCYSGALTRSSLARFDGASEKERWRWMEDLAAKRSRTALTSGGLAPVLDAGGGGHSIFARSVLDALGQTSGPLESSKLWSTVKTKVMHATRYLRREQIPEYSPIRFAGHEGGEFFFVPARG